MEKKMEAWKSFQSIYSLSRRFFLNAIDCGFNNIKHLTQFFSASTRCLDVSNIFIIKLVLRHSVLIPRVHHIVHLASNKKMLWVYAGWVIAFVADISTFWNWSHKMRVRESMSMENAGAVPKTSIATNIFRSSPLPASIRKNFIFLLKPYFVGQSIASSKPSDWVIFKFLLAPKSVVMIAAQIAANRLFSAFFAKRHHEMNPSFVGAMNAI